MVFSKGFKTEMTLFDLETSSLMVVDVLSVMLHTLLNVMHCYF